MPDPAVPHRCLRTVFCSETDTPDRVASILRFRKRILVDRLGWRLHVENGQECDEFDTPHAVHCAVLSGDEIIACFRAIRTDRPYLARSKFPFLATTHPYPVNPLIWEISRLAVSETARPFEVLLYAYSAVFHFARIRGAISLVAFAEVAKERLVTRIGIKTKLLGDPAEIGTDAYGRPILCVAGELPLRDQGGPRFEKLMSYVAKMEIDDAATVLGRASIPA